jgi:hypothetical protein
MNACAVVRTAFPDMTAERLCHVPNPSSSSLVEAQMMRIPSGGICSASAHTCANTVSWPCPELVDPT